MMLLYPQARAEGTADALLARVGFDRLEALARELGVEGVGEIAASALSGELKLDGDLAGRAIRRLGGLLREGLLGALSALAAPVIATLCLRLVLGRRDGPLTLLCRLACACALAQRCAEAVEVAAEAMGRSARVASAASPVLAAALTATGSGASGAMLSPLAALCASAIEDALVAVGLPACVLTAVVAIAGNLSESYRLDALFRVLKGATVWGVRLLIGGFVGLLAVEGRLAAARDAATSQALGQAIRGLIPFVGGSISDSAGALLESAAAARNAVGVTGMAIALLACAGPALRLSAYMLSLQLASAVIEPVADAGIARITAGLGDVAKLLLALCAGSALLSALLGGACLGLFGVL